jgi:peptidyl-prolyl cis-trans isomerase A (cyclophilin A)
MKAHRSLSLATLALLSLAACGKTEEPSSQTTTQPSVTAPPPATTGAAPQAAAPGKPLASTLHPGLLTPDKANEKAPDAFKVKFTTTKGDIVVDVHRDWSPNGADRIYNLVKMGFFDDTRFFRAIDGFMVQFGINGDPAVNRVWQERGIPDDPVKHSNTKGTVTFAQKNTPGSRTTQIFINLVDNARLDPSNFAPFGQVAQGMDVVDSLYKGYGEGAPMGAGPDQMSIQMQGNHYLDAMFPKLDGISHAEIVK